MNMGDKIRILRKNLGLTLEEVGNSVGVSKSTVRKWESGDIANMRRDKIANLARSLCTTPAYLMGWEDPDDVQNYFEEKKADQEQVRDQMLLKLYHRAEMSEQHIIDCVLEKYLEDDEELCDVGVVSPFLSGFIAARNGLGISELNKGPVPDLSSGKPTKRKF